MKKIFVLLFLLVGLNSFGQKYYSKQIIVGSGGVFEYATPYKDYVSMVYYDLGIKTPVPKVFDSIYTQSIQDLKIDDGFAYVAAQDSIIKYDLNTYNRVATVAHSKLKSLNISGDYLLVGNFFGSAPFFSVYNKQTLKELFSVKEIDQMVDGAVIVGDSIYVGYNEQGTVDIFPPYKVYLDTLGKIAVINLKTKSFVRDIKLDTTGAGIRQLYVKDDIVYAVCTESGFLIGYNVKTGKIDAKNIGIVNLTTFEDSILYADFNSQGIGSFNLNTGKMENPSIVKVSNGIYAASTHDSISNKFYLTKTDYFNYGKVFIYDGAGQMTDSFDVGISPEAIAVDYRKNSSSSITDLSDFGFELYPNPANSVLNVKLNNFVESSEVSIYDINASELYRKQIVNNNVSISVNNFKPGIYILQVKSDKSILRKKFIKH